MIEIKYESEARVAADALRAALIAVEACGADEELTKIVVRLSDDRTRLCNLFGMNTPQAYQAPGPGREWSPRHRAYVVGESRVIAQTTRVQLETEKLEHAETRLEFQRLRVKWWDHFDRCSLDCTDACDEMHTYEPGCFLDHSGAVEYLSEQEHLDASVVADGESEVSEC